MTSTRAARNSTPAVNVHNENPSLVALGKLTYTNPRATHKPTNQRNPAQPSNPARPSPAHGTPELTNPRTSPAAEPSPVHPPPRISP